MEKYAWLAILTLAQIVQFLVVKRNGRKTSNNPGSNSVPGKNQVCTDHSNQLAKLNTEVEYLREDIKEAKKDTEKNFDIIYAELRKGK